MPTADRRGRLARVDGDLRRRPADGFRTADGRRFLTLVRRGITVQRGEVADHLRGAVIQIHDVPDAAALAVADGTGEVPLVRFTSDPSGPTVRVYRRPVELRATGRHALESIIATAIEDAVRDAMGLPPAAES